MIGVLVT
jgi:hypothetical protein